MIVHLRENSFKKIFLTESTNSRRADKQTQEAIAQRLGTTVNDPRVIETQRNFRQYYFGVGGVNDDWFIVLEPNFYLIASDIGAFDDGNTAFNLRRIIQYLHSKCISIGQENGRQAMLSYVSQLRNNLVNGESFHSFIGQLYSEKYGDDNEENATFEKGNYMVIGPLTYDIAEYFGMFTDSHDTGGVICYTSNPYTWNDYTNEGEKALYIMLRDDWDMLDSANYRCEAYDDYALSMIFIMVDSDGELSTCNVRWNDDPEFPKDRYADGALDEDEISQLLGRPFSEVFKPLQEVGYMPIEKVEEITGEIIE
jgi:hypothetical protein